MSRRPLTAALLSAALLSACGTGLEAQTYQGRAPHDSTSAEVGDIAVRGLAVEAPEDGTTIAKGKSATVTGILVNGGTEDDTLTGASSDASSSVAIAAPPADCGSQIAGGSPACPLFPASTVKIPAGGTSGTEWKLMLTDLSRDLRTGEYVSVTLEFAKAGRTTLQVPVRSGDNGLEDREEARDPYHVGE